MGLDDDGPDRRMSTGLRAHSKPISGVAYLLLIALLIWFSIAVYNKDLPWQAADTVTLTTTAPGLELNPHSDVKFQGLRVGEVRTITSDGRSATITLALDKGSLKLLPANIDAAIVPKTLFGEKFVDLRLPSQPVSARLTAGGRIQQSTTSVEIGALFSKLVPVLNALQPQQLSVILNSLAQALDGRGETLATGFNQLRAFLTKVDPHLDTFTHDIGQFAKTADIYADAAPDLVRILSATADISRELLVPKEQEFSSFLSQVTGTSGQVKQVLAQNADNLIRLSGRSRAVLALLDQYSVALPCFLKGLHTFSILSDQAIGARGPFTNLVVDVASNNTPYKNPGDLPSNPNSDGNNANLPAGIPGWAPHCPQFSKEVLALKDAAPNSMPLPGTSINAPGSPAATAAAPSPAAVTEARNALARAMAARSMGVPVSQVPGYADLLVGPMLTDGQVTVR
ncbi:MCE family protein [Nocardioides marmorisolisilvae]|uniref:MCE family protein n=1 Tax=Nocardioides marmorisolisilvae TaxID=1542737 RepID=A0A3N0DZS5_9ACTN|nr:MCE family protein [Nocardioides marmorisolisilvae]RNL81108.1 MCE family protein [Nocardioides marmorisolisilvae]